jgi:hypothetical protein
MSPAYQEYYQQLQTAFQSLNDSDRTEMERIEACFKSSLDYWGKVCKQVREDGYRYHALLFLPTGDILEKKRFWRWEERKIERFYENNREFCVYMKEGDINAYVLYEEYIRNFIYINQSNLPP